MRLGSYSEILIWTF